MFLSESMFRSRYARRICSSIEIERVLRAFDWQRIDTSKTRNHHVLWIFFSLSIEMKHTNKFMMISTIRWIVLDRCHRLIRQFPMDIVIPFNGRLWLDRTKSIVLSRWIVFYCRTLKYNDTFENDQPSSFDILDFSYSILLATFDLLRRLTIKDCLHTCLQLNNSVCQIIDLYIKHNYGNMNVMYNIHVYLSTQSFIEQTRDISSWNSIRFFSIVYIHWLNSN
jgi:hypothetical protein